MKILFLFLLTLSCTNIEISTNRKISGNDDIRSRVSEFSRCLNMDLNEVLHLQKKMEKLEATCYSKSSSIAETESTRGLVRKNVSAGYGMLENATRENVKIDEVESHYTTNSAKQYALKDKVVSIQNFITDLDDLKKNIHQLQMNLSGLLYTYDGNQSEQDVFGRDNNFLMKRRSMYSEKINDYNNYRNSFRSEKFKSYSNIIIDLFKEGQGQRFLSSPCPKI